MQPDWVENDLDSDEPLGDDDWLDVSLGADPFHSEGGAGVDEVPKSVLLRMQWIERRLEQLELDESDDPAYDREYTELHREHSELVTRHYCPKPDDLRPGETLDERNRRLLERNWQERIYTTIPIDWKGDPKEPFRLIDVRTGFARRPPRPTREKTKAGPLTIYYANGDTDIRAIGNDENALLTFLQAQARAVGVNFDELIAPIPRGRLSHDNWRRREVLAQVIAAARDRGATLASIGRLTGRSKQTVLHLERHARTGELNQV